MKRFWAPSERLTVVSADADPRLRWPYVRRKLIVTSCLALLLLGISVLTYYAGHHDLSIYFSGLGAGVPCGTTVMAVIDFRELRRETRRRRDEVKRLFDEAQAKSDDVMDRRYI